MCTWARPLPRYFPNHIDSYRYFLPVLAGTLRASRGRPAEVTLNSRPPHHERSPHFSHSQDRRAPLFDLFALNVRSESCSPSVHTRQRRAIPISTHPPPQPPITPSSTANLSVIVSKSQPPHTPLKMNIWLER
jgi:hypothetical protein